ncbi:MAG: AAA family ATPase [Actinomycetota bacterium]
MRIEKLIMKNYRQYRDEILHFRSTSECDLTVFIGRNGTGKSNILNAINWCLYKEEPHLNDESVSMPPVTMDSVLQSPDGSEHSVSVELYIDSGEGGKIVFNRTARYKVFKETAMAKIEMGELYRYVSTYMDLEVQHIKKNGETDYFSEDEDVEFFIDTFIPKNIRGFFIFDGERLSSYFKVAVQKNIRSAILSLSRIEVLETIKDRLGTILTEYNREAGRYSPELEEIEKQLNQAIERENEASNMLNEAQVQIDSAKTQIEEHKGEIEGCPDAMKLNTERDELKDKVQLTNKRREKNHIEYLNSLFELGKTANSKAALTSLLDIINKKIQNHELPPPIENRNLEQSLKDGKCVLCGVAISKETENHIKETMKQISTSSFAARRLSELENPLHRVLEKERALKINIASAIEKIQDCDKQIQKAQTRIEEIDHTLLGHNKDSIREHQEQILILEDVYMTNLIALGTWKTRRDEIRKGIPDIKRRRDDEMEKRKDIEELKGRICVCETAFAKASDARESILSKTREYVEEETNKAFSKLMWKKKTYKRIKIKEDYSLSVIHVSGQEWFPHMSAAERQLLVLSFTIALHTLAGFDSPLIIDTPVARVDDENRENFAEAFAKISQAKQVVLILSPTEWSSEISGVLDRYVGGKYRLDLNEEETETRVKEA